MMLGTERQERGREMLQEENKHCIRKDIGWFLIQENPLLYMRKDSEYSPWQRRKLAIRTGTAVYPANLLSFLISYFSFCYYRTNPGLWIS